MATVIIPVRSTSGAILYTVNGEIVGVERQAQPALFDSRFSSYEIYFYDTSGTRVLLLEGYEYLEFAQRIDDSWNHQIRMEFGPEDTRLTFFREELTRDYIVEIFRYDPVIQAKELVYEGFHRTLVDQMKQNGVTVLTMYGTGYTSLLKRRIVIPATGEENSAKSGPAETVIKEFVDEQAVNPVDTDREITGLSIEADSGIGNTAEYSARYTNLFTACARTAEQGDVDFGVVGGAAKGTFELQVRELWGTDRSRGNAGGIAPTIFDVTLGNMLIPILSTRGSDEINHVYVGGQGQGVNRAIEEYEYAAAKTVSPWNRWEAFVDARNESTSQGLETEGRAYLELHRVRGELTFNIQQTDGTRWLRDWELGDIVSARYAGQEFTKKIVQVTVIVSAGSTGQQEIEVISAEIEDV